MTLERAIAGFGKLELVSTDIEPVVAEADIILVVVPAISHATMAEAGTSGGRGGMRSAWA